MGFLIEDLKYRWPGGVVPFVFDAELRGNMLRSQVYRQAMAYIQARTAVRFVARTREPDFIHFHTSRFGSYVKGVGNRGGDQELNLHFGDGGQRTMMFTAVHELCQKLGLFLEHVRPDRDRFVLIPLWDQFVDLVFNFGRDYGIVRRGGRILGPYDFASAMHYSRPLTLRDGRPVPQQSGHLTDSDLAALRHMYPAFRVHATTWRPGWSNFSTFNLGKTPFLVAYRRQEPAELAVDRIVFGRGNSFEPIRLQRFKSTYHSAQNVPDWSHVFSYVSGANPE
ncbi:MAG: M12 family metallopeptidase [Bacteroidota bacterium]